ncbi:MAG: dienelactone hydrolase family protein [Anaerolineales bacterium]|nr:dienelactone hydrolase family protein [Anaerolineales bacterium]
MWRWIRRILLGLGVLVLAVGVLVAGSIAVDGLGAAGRLAAVANTTIANPAGPAVSAYVARPAGDGPFPAVIMIHEFYGLNDGIRAKADLLAAAGYLVVAPDVFRGSTTGYIPRAIYQVLSTPAEQVNQDLDAVLAWLTAQPDVAADRVAIAGFCFGGRTSLLFSLHNPQLAGTVIFYGSPVADPERLKALPGPVLGIFGGADGSIPLADVQAFEAALETAGVPHQISIYAGQPHAFVNSVDAIRAGGVQGQAWEELLAFLRTSLQEGNSGRPPAAAARADDFYGLRNLALLAFAHLAPAHAH